MMKNHRHLSLLSILIFLAIFIAVSVVIYHYPQQRSLTTLANGNATLFPEPQPIKPFQLLSGDTVFSEKDLRKNWTLLVFGFTHCTSICPNTLRSLATALNNLQMRYPNLQVLFVSLDPERDDKNQVVQYAKSFNPHFIGATTRLSDLRKLQSQFRIFSEREGDAGPQYQINHTTSILLINPKGEWVGLFKYGQSPQVLSESVKLALDSLKA